MAVSVGVALSHLRDSELREHAACIVHGSSQSSSYLPRPELTVIQLRVPGEMPSPGPRPHEVQASPRLDCSSILPSAPTGRVPAPSEGNGRTRSSWFSASVFVATNVTAHSTLCQERQPARPSLLNHRPSSRPSIGEGHVHHSSGCGSRLAVRDRQRPTTAKSVPPDADSQSGAEDEHTDRPDDHHPYCRPVAHDSPLSSARSRVYSSSEISPRANR